MVLIAPPPSNSIRYRPRLHQPAPSRTASTWGRKFVEEQQRQKDAGDFSVPILTRPSGARLAAGVG